MITAHPHALVSTDVTRNMFIINSGLNYHRCVKALSFHSILTQVNCVHKVALTIVCYDNLCL